MLLPLNPFARAGCYCKARRATEADAEAGEVVVLSAEDRVPLRAGAGLHRWQRPVARRGNGIHICSVGRALIPRTIGGTHRENRKGLPHPETFRQCSRLATSPKI